MNKRLLSMMLVGVALFSVACSTGNNDTTQTTQEEQTTQASQSNEESQSFSSISFNGKNLSVGTNVDDALITELGTPLDIIDAPSCHFDGEDTIYAYEDVVLYAYQDADKQNLYIIEINSANVPTNKGAKVGMTKDEVIKLHGENYAQNGLILGYTEGEVSIDFTLDASDVVTMIEIIQH